MRTYKSKYFYGNKISDYGLENGYVDYATLAKSFNLVLNNSIMENTLEIGFWEQESGFCDNSDDIDELQDKIDELQDKIDELEQEEGKEEQIASLEEEIKEMEEEIESLEEEQENYYPECFQYYIVSDDGAEILKDCNEIVFYNDKLEMYVWGVTHWGTNWDYVLTNIKLDLNDCD